MIPIEHPKDASVMKDGDFWVAVVAGVRFERFRSEDDAWGWVLCLCSEDDADDEISEHQRVLRGMRMALANPPIDPDERARLKRTFVLAERGYAMRVMKAADAGGAVKQITKGFAAA